MEVCHNFPLLTEYNDNLEEPEDMSKFVGTKTLYI
ncbi:hypothetical protein TorRG33x02_048840 [Trema orientale]|uniref:Uncharacterized protein n=1 Tax=Trema orientale TaxID=63057 RepID=A0A2P5FNE7_TREOI|nr:hypothetical protein TorRG33x02_048840 [Trema orientale]